MLRPTASCSSGGHSIGTLAARVGQTPFYAYRRDMLRARVAQLRSALPAQVKLHYAMKAKPMPAMGQFMAGLLDGIDVASAGELQVALTEYQQLLADMDHRSLQGSHATPTVDSGAGRAALGIGGTLADAASRRAAVARRRQPHSCALSLVWGA